MSTMIQVGNATREELKSLSRKGETYDAVIRRLLRAREYVGFIEEQHSILNQSKGWKKLEDLP
jgi:hypothetical protein